MTQTKNTEKKILVLGGTGKTGSRIITRLTQLGLPVRLGSRTAEIPFNWEDSSNWNQVLENVKAIYITFQPDLAIPGAAACIELFTRMAVENGVERLVLLSGRGEEEAQHCEQIVQRAGIDWTILRSSWFFQNFSESYLLEDVLSGQVILPVGNIGEPFIDTEDIADVAVAALTGEGHQGQVYELTGPQLLTFKEVISGIAKGTGKEIQYKQVSPDEYTSILIANQVPQAYIDLLSYLFTQVMDGRNASLGDGVQRAIHRDPANFSAFVDNTLKTGIWKS